MLSNVFLQPSVFTGLAQYVSRRSLQLCGASCHQALDLVFCSAAWRSVDFSQWMPLENHQEPGDLDLFLALKRLPPGALRRLILQSRRISSKALRQLFLTQNQIEELLLDTCHGDDVGLSHAFAFAPRLKHLELLGPSTLLTSLDAATSFVSSVETLVLHLPSLTDLQDGWTSGWVQKGQASKTRIIYIKLYKYNMYDLFFALCYFEGVYSLTYVLSSMFFDFYP